MLDWIVRLSATHRGVVFLLVVLIGIEFVRYLLVQSLRDLAFRLAAGELWVPLA